MKFLISKTFYLRQNKFHSTQIHLITFFDSQTCILPLFIEHDGATINNCAVASVRAEVLSLHHVIGQN